MVFAIVTQIQFGRIADEKIYQTELDAFRTAETAYDVATKAYDDCVVSVGVREVYRGIFTGISTLFQRTAELPARLLPDSREATQYREELTAEVENMITNPVREQLPPRSADDCPQIPLNEPTRPNR